MMRSFERNEVVTLLNVDRTFVDSLERASIIHVDVEGQRFSTRMFERVRVAHSLVFELKVNLSGVAVILRMREELGGTRGALRRVERRVEAILAQQVHDAPVDVPEQNPDSEP